MFTGIIEEVGSIDRIQNGAYSAVLLIKAKEILTDVKIGDSIAVNGVCLTVTSLWENKFSADIMHETLDRTGLSSLKSGSHVNLERAMILNGRFGGHIVAGHIDGVGKVIRTWKDDNAIWYNIQADKSVMKYIVEKGSIAIDGISLTVAEVRENNFLISAIPHTVEVTVLKERIAGELVNIETDIIGKYIEKFINNPKKENDISKEFLIENGF